MSNNKELDLAIGKALSHLRDTSIRDGIQSWDANKWQINDIIPVVKQIDALAATLKQECGVNLPPIEAWGGGQVAQPAKFLSEDPFVNLERLHEATPNLELQCLYRGRQGFGFTPVSPEIQNAAITTAADKGVKVFRIFDMMNDMENLQTGIAAVKKYQAEHPDSDVKLEGAVAYISEPKIAGKGRAWELKEYADMAVKLAEQGCNEIAIKNFSGTGDYEMPELVSTMRAALNEAGFENIALNLHTHGCKPDVLAECIKAGASKVDVGIGALSDGPAHSNMREMVYHLLQNTSFNKDTIDAHPVMQQLAQIEATIDTIVARKGADGKSFDDKRAPLKTLVANPELLESSRMAAGALSDLTSRIQKDYEKTAQAWAIAGKSVPTQDELIQRALAIGAELWEKAGRFNTVTPGAKILVDQMLPLAITEVYGKPRNMTMYKDTLIDVAAGRYGKNQGMEKGIGNQKWRDALLMFRALRELNKRVDGNTVNKEEAGVLLADANLAAGGAITLKLNGTVQLDDPKLEEKLMASNIETFRSAVKKSPLKDDLKQQLLKELTPGRSPEPTAGLEAGNQIVKALKTTDGHDVSPDALRGGMLENQASHWPLLAALLRNPDDRNPHEAIENVVSAAVGQKVTSQNAVSRLATVAQTTAAPARLM